jgi:quinol monooxygenase YgiN
MAAITQMITQLARYEMQSGMETRALEAFKTMAAAVKANEPGCLLYAVTRGQVNAKEVYVYEIYEDQTAFDDHRRTDHVREFRAAMEQYLDRSVFNIEMVDEVAGFCRGAIEEMSGQM